VSEVVPPEFSCQEIGGGGTGLLRPGAPGLGCKRDDHRKVRKDVFLEAGREAPMIEPDHDQGKSEAFAGQMVSILNNAAVVQHDGTLWEV